MQSIISQSYISKDDFVDRFTKITYAHKKLAEYIYDAGFKSFDELKKSDPELIYSLICIRNNQNFDYNILFDLKAIVAQME